MKKTSNYPEARLFLGTLEEFIHGLLISWPGNKHQVPVIREVLPDESVGVLFHSMPAVGIMISK
jgi:hypothetical protein